MYEKKFKLVSHSKIIMRQSLLQLTLLNNIFKREVREEKEEKEKKTPEPK